MRKKAHLCLWETTKHAKAEKMEHETQPSGQRKKQVRAAFCTFFSGREYTGTKALPLKGAVHRMAAHT
jgi:hypothetical protein